MSRTGARFPRSDRVKVIRNQRAAAGVCTKCGKNKPDEGFLMCRICLDKRIESRRKTTSAETTNNSHPSVKRNKIEARGDASLSKQEASP